MMARCTGKAVRTATLGAALGLGMLLACRAMPEAVAAPAEVRAAAPAPHPGQAVYRERCASCHDNAASMRIPSLTDMKALSPAQLGFTLSAGKMKQQAEGIGRKELQALIDYLAPGHGAGYEVSAASYCADRSIDMTALVQGWGGSLADNSRYYAPAVTSVSRANIASAKIAWVFGLPSTSTVRSHPSITADTIFVSTQSGHVLALDREEGCVKWHRNLGRPVRGPTTFGEVNGSPALLLLDAAARVHALFAADGATIWTHDAALFEQSMGTAGIAQHENRLFVPLSATDVGAAMDPAYECCRGHGAVVALDADTGARMWTAHMTADAKPTTRSTVGTQLWGPSGAPVWTTPAVDAANGRIYIGTGENTSKPATATSDAIMALSMETGEILWKYQATANDTFNMACSFFRKSGPNCPSNPAGPDLDFGGGVSMAKMSDGREIVVGGQKSGVVHAVDAATGEKIWTTRVGAGSALGGVHWGVTVAKGRVFAPVSDPDFPLPGYNPTPGLYALDIDTGELVWAYRVERGCELKGPAFALTSDEAWPDCPRQYAFSAAPTSTAELVFAPALDGKLRVFDADTGDVLWTYDTKREFESVNEVAAHGGAIDNAGVQLAGEMFFVQSGYAMFGQMPGNALIAFRVDDAH